MTTQNVSKLNKFKSYFQKSNFIDLMTFQKKVYVNATEEEKKEFADEIKKYGLELRYTIHGDWTLIQLSKNEEILGTEELQEIGFFDSYSEPIKEVSEFKFMQSNKYDREYNKHCGWLSPTGELIQGAWGKHTTQAFEIVREQNWNEEYREYESTTPSEDVRDFVCLKGYALIDCPDGSGYVKVSYVKMSKEQKNFLIDYFLSIKDSENVDNLVS